LCHKAKKTESQRCRAPSKVMVPIIMVRPIIIANVHQL